MTDLVNDLGVQSFVLRNWKKPEELLSRLKEAGLSRIELWAGHYDMSDPESLRGISRLFTENGISITGLGALRLTENEPYTRKLFELSEIVGADVMIVDFPIASVPGCFRVAEKLAEEFGIRLAIHNHGGNHWLSNRDALDWIFGQTGSSIGLCLDTGWFLDARHDPVEMAERYQDRLYDLHFKDFVYERVRKPVDKVLGEGLLDLPGFIGVLRKMDYSGYVSLEYEGDMEDPVPALRKCAMAIEGCL